MIELFSPEGMEALRRQITPRTLFAFDFDGTLTGLVANPNDVRMTETASRALKELAHLAPTAVISGRALRDLQRHLPEGPLLLVGNHGIENPAADAKTLQEFRAAVEEWRNHVQPFAADHIFIEDKEYSLSLHYRHHPAPDHARERLLAAAESLTPKPRIVLGKFVVNLVPEGAAHKGTALLELVLRTNSEKILFVGDDITDEDIFGLHDPRLMSIKVGREKTLAPYFVDAQEQVERLLQFAVACLKG